MKKTTYAIIALLVIIALAELVIILMVKSTEHPYDYEWVTTEADTPPQPARVSTLTIEMPEDWTLYIPYNAKPDSIANDIAGFEADTIILISPHATIFAK